VAGRLVRVRLPTVHVTWKGRKRQYATRRVRLPAKVIRALHAGRRVVLKLTITERAKGRRPLRSTQRGRLKLRQ